MKGAADVTVMETEDPFEEYPQMENIDAVLQRERSPLLSLPPEILQNILYHMDAATCFVSLLSCTTIYEAAQTKRVLLRHLNRMPGLRLGSTATWPLSVFSSPFVDAQPRACVQLACWPTFRNTSQILTSQISLYRPSRRANRC